MGAMTQDTTGARGIEIRHLRYFVAVAQELSFTRAADRVGTSQPSLSQQILQLEGMVGAQLLSRSRHHVALTEAGRMFLQHATDVLSRIERAAWLAHRTADGLAGDLSAGTFASADARILPLLRERVESRLPDVRLIWHSKYAIDPVEGLRTGALDVAFMRGPFVADDLVVEELMREPLTVLLPKGHPLAGRARIPVRSLDDLPCVALECSHASVLNDAIANLFRQGQSHLHVVARADNVLSGLQLVQEGLGFAVMPDSIAALMPPGIVVRPLDLEPAPTVSIVVAWKAGNTSRLVQAFIDVVRDCFEDRDDTPLPDAHIENGDAAGLAGEGEQSRNHLIQ
jgi:LysR family hca operon transcriptional activator